MTAKHTDFMVPGAMDSRPGPCFELERFSRLDGPIQKERIVSFAQKHRDRLILDATGVLAPYRNTERLRGRLA